MCNLYICELDILRLYKVVQGGTLLYKYSAYRGQTDRGYKKPVTNTDIEIAIPLGMKRMARISNRFKRNWNQKKSWIIRVKRI